MLSYLEATMPVPAFAAILSWVIAQLIKTLIFAIKNKTFNKERLVGAGGMPSAHSAGVLALCTEVGKLEGWTSNLFSVAAVFALITLYDALSVRRSAGYHAREINLIKKELKPDDEFKKLKEFLGHSPVEVLVGSLFGIFMGIII